MINTADVFEPHYIYQEGQFARLAKPDSVHALSLVYCESQYYLQQAIQNQHVSVIITSTALVPLLDQAEDIGIIVSQNPRLDYWALHGRLVEAGLAQPNFVEAGIGTNCQIHPSAIISETVQIGNSVSIGACAVIEAYSIIGNSTLIAPGAVIGAEGLQTYSISGRKEFIRHAGGVKIGSGVTILANAVISKAIYPDYTVVDDNTQVSLLSSVGHQSRIGANCSIAGNVLIGGSVEMGDGVWVGPSATIKDGLTIGANAQIKLGSVVVKDIGEGEVVSGNFAIPHRLSLREYARKIK
ncbi:MAG: hypothetical protein AAF702_04095 [Chloroflexota bacterium]